MKRLLILTLVFGLFACSKNNTGLRSAVSTDSTYIEFKLNHVLKSYSEINAVVVPSYGSLKTYSFVATKQPTSENYFSFIIQTDSLAIGTYNLKNDNVVLFRDGGTIATNVNGSGITFTVTSNVNGEIEGYFSGELFNQTTSSISTVIEGKVHHVQLLYKP
jgi:hypothetical protein